MEKMLRRVVLLVLLCSFQANSGVYQIYPTLAYVNAAELNTVNHYDFILGSYDILSNVRYNGFINTDYGSAVSKTNGFLPYFRAASRINPKWVLSFDISRPLYSNINYPNDSLVDPVGTDSILFDVNYSPKVSYQINNYVAVGLGLDFNNVTNFEINFDEPSAFHAFNQSSGWGYGWDFGISIKMDPFNTFNLTYYSKIFFNNLTGTSKSKYKVMNNFSNTLLAPETFIFNLTHQVKPSLKLYETARFARWGEEPIIEMRNSVQGSYNILLDYVDTWSITLGFNEKLDENWTFGGLVSYEGNQQNIFMRPATFPATSSISAGTSLEYAISDKLNAKFDYFYVYANPKIAREGPPVQSGRVIMGINIFDFVVSYKI